MILESTSGSSNTMVSSTYRFQYTTPISSKDRGRFLKGVSAFRESTICSELGDLK